MSSLRTTLDLDIDSGDDVNSTAGPILVHSGFFSAYNNSALKPGIRTAVADLMAQVGASMHKGSCST